MNPLNRTDYDPGTYGERRVVDYVAAYFENHEYNLHVSRVPVLPDRENLFIHTGVDEDKETTLLQTHADTVEGKDMDFSPFRPFLEGDRVYGRGSCDAKGQLVSMIIGLEMALARTKGDLPVNVCLALALAVDEEHLHRGVDQLVEAGFRAKGAVVGEPTDLRLACALKGSLRFRVETKGISAHTSVPHRGKNAIYLMRKLIAAIEEKIIPQGKMAPIRSAEKAAFACP